MIVKLIIWLAPFIIILSIQYGVGEYFLIRRNRLYRSGYFFVVFLMLVEILYAVYVYKFVDYMDFLGLAQLLFASYLFHRFVKRWSSLVNPRFRK